MLHALQPAQLRRMDKKELKIVAENCERALLAGISTHQDMMTLIEVEKEILRRERIDTKQQILDVRKTLAEQPVLTVSTQPSSKLSSINPESSVILEPEPIETQQEGPELLPVAPNRF
jgi:uncharacterized circularly permuted ATP-grasp superfamily protein